jgi:hypothetical protein
MSIPATTVIAGITCFEDALTPGRVYWLPGAVRPQRSEGGQPKLSFLSAAGLNLFQFTSEWTLAPEQLKALELELRTRSALQELLPAPLAVSGASLELIEAAEHHVLQRAVPSTVPPFGCVFSLTPDPSQAQAIREALAGQAARLVIRYEAVVEVKQWAQAGIRGDPAGAANLDAGLDAGTLTWQQQTTPGTPDGVLQRAVVDARPTWRPG